MALAKLPMLPEYAISYLPDFMPQFFLGRLTSLLKEHSGFVSRAEHVYLNGWKDALRREPLLFQRLVDEVDWQPNHVPENHKKAQAFFTAEAESRGTTVHHMLFGFPEKFDEWFDSADKGGDRDAPAERTLLLKFLLKDVDPRIIEGLRDYQDEPLRADGFLKTPYFVWVWETRGQEHVASTRSLLREFCRTVTGLHYFDVYAQGGIPVSALKQITRNDEAVIIDATVFGVDVLYAACAVTAGVTDLDLIVRGSKDGLPVEYMAAVR